MRRMLGVVLVMGLATSVVLGQFKSEADQKPAVSESLVRTDNGGMLFGFLDPNNFSMRQSYSLSYSSFGGRGLSLGVYTNSIFYKFSAPLDVQFDVSVVHSPFGGFGAAANNLSGIYLSRAELNYHPSNNIWLQIQFRQLPNSYWYGDPYGTSRYFGWPVPSDNP
jgi:hypothetical protein